MKLDKIKISGYKSVEDVELPIKNMVIVEVIPLSFLEKTKLARAIH